MSRTPLRWAVYYEPEGYGDPSAAQIHADLLYLRSHYFSKPAYLRVNGQPVVEEGKLIGVRPGKIVRHISQ